MKKHLIVVSVIAVILSAGLGYLSMHTNLIPRPASVERQFIDDFLKILFGIASVFFAVIISFFVYSLIFFRAGPGDRGYGRPFKGNSALEWAWTLIPLIIVLVLAAYGGVVLGKMIEAGEPGSELEIEVTASRYVWEFYYPADNITTYELHVPVNQRVHFSMQATDVIHSFWVQEWGPKQDIVPGMTTEVRYTPTKTGSYFVECSQLCGYGHTYMIAPVFVTSEADYQSWIEQKRRPPAPGPTSPATVTTTVPASTPAVANVTIDLVSQNSVFSLSTITVPAGVEVTVNFSNLDKMPHNLAVYTDSTAKTPVFEGEIFSGPATVVYKFKAPAKPGTYFFRCDVHPLTMTGQFIVQ